MNGPGRTPHGGVAPFSWGIVAVAAVAAAAHFAVAGQYGIFRDELYYLACARRLAWGYVDHPPAVAVLAWLGATLFGESPAGLRVLPILVGAAAVVVSGDLARQLGGGRFAQVITALAVALATGFLFLFHILSMNGLEILLWTAAAWLVVRRLRHGAPPATWLWFGVVCGAGLLTKHSLAFFGAGLAAGLLLTRARRELAVPHLWAGLAIALAAAAPHVWWQAAHGWPVVEFARNAQAGKITPLSPLAFLGQALLQVGPAPALLVVAGLVALLAWRAFRDVRALGIAALVVLAILVTSRAKPYYAGPLFPLLFAAGAVWLEARLRERRSWRWGFATAFVAAAVAVAPLALPVLPLPLFLEYSRRIGLAPASGERHTLGELPQHYADMFGWESMAATVSRVYQGLEPEERAAARVFGQNYGEAGAMEYFAARYPLPPAIAGHNNYYLWGPGEGPIRAVIIIGGKAEDHARVFARVDEVARTSCDHCMPYERNLPVFVGREPKLPLHEIWPAVKHFD
jgi:hypothetical protein